MDQWYGNQDESGEKNGKRCSQCGGLFLLHQIQPTGHNLPRADLDLEADTMHAVDYHSDTNSTVVVSFK